MRSAFILILFIVSAWVSATAQTITYPSTEIPETTRLLFAKDGASDSVNKRDLTMAPDGSELFYSIQQKGFRASTIVRMYQKDGKWSKPETASFSGKYLDLEASFSPDGKRIWFASNRPVDANDTVKDFDMWYVDKTAKGWGQPVHAGFVVNSAGNEFYPSVAKSGNLYFTAKLKSGNGKEDIVMCEWKNGKYSAPVILPEGVNSKGDEFNAFIDPDEQFILFSSYGRADDMGGGDLYISNRDQSGNWLPAQNLGADINSKYLDYCPFVSPDRKFLFFSSNRPLNQTPGATRGLDDIYWIVVKQR